MTIEPATEIGERLQEIDLAASRLAAIAAISGSEISAAIAALAKVIRENTDAIYKAPFYADRGQN